MTRVISNVLTSAHTFNLFTKSFFTNPPSLVYSNGVINSNTLIGPLGTNGLLTFSARSTTGNLSTQIFTISTNPFVTTAASFSQTATITNQSAQPITGGSVTKSTTTTTIYTELPMVMTNRTYAMYRSMLIIRRTRAICFCWTRNRTGFTTTPPTSPWTVVDCSRQSTPPITTKLETQSSHWLKPRYRAMS